MVKRVTGPIINRIKGHFNTGITKGDLDQLTRGLRESINENEIIGLKGIKSASDREKIVSMLSNIDDIMKRINGFINDINRYNSDSVVVKSKLLNSVKDKNKADTALKLMSNFKTLVTIKNMLNDSDGLSDSLRSILAEMFFGSTKLPI